MAPRAGAERHVSTPDDRWRSPLETPEEEPGTEPATEPEAPPLDGRPPVAEEPPPYSWSEPVHDEPLGPPPVPPPAPPFSWPIPEEEPTHEFHHPLDRVTGRLPRRLRITVDWIVTIVGAIAIVLAIKAWVVNPYRIPSSSMEPTLHCARPATGCEAKFSDRVLANRFIYRFRDPKRGEVVVFETPPKVKAACNAGGTFVKRIIGLPGESLELRLIRGREFVFINGQRLEEPYVTPERRAFGPEKMWTIPQDNYFLMGDNRTQSCDSSDWGSIGRDNLIGPVFMTYWPPNRISFR
jgi:signal peptidase I